VGFACATCHRVDTTDRLIGPGLLGVGNPAHDPSDHETGHRMAMHDVEETEHRMDPTRDTNSDPVEYLRTSILDPGAFVVSGFPDNLMPKTYSQIFTEDEISDLVAYLMTLQ
jgi:cytochrome c2